MEEILIKIKNIADLFSEKSGGQHLYKGSFNISPHHFRFELWHFYDTYLPCKSYWFDIAKINNSPEDLFKEWENKEKKEAEQKEKTISELERLINLTDVKEFNKFMDRNPNLISNLRKEHREREKDGQIYYIRD
jgi:hypothetical protein